MVRQTFTVNWRSVSGSLISEATRQTRNIKFIKTIVTTDGSWLIYRLVEMSHFDQVNRPFEFILLQINSVNLQPILGSYK
jgi:hypothetical protein